jgi:cytochrome c peroxidase
MTKEDQTAITWVVVAWAKAIAAYEQQLVSTDSAFDRFMAGGDPLSDSAIRGARLFVGKAACIECHNTPLFSDNQFHNIGIPQLAPAPLLSDCGSGGVCDCVKGSNCIPFGFFDGLKKLQAPSKFRRDNAVFSDDPTDASRASFYAIAPDDSVKGAWRTPSLRDVAVTGPYMHDGAYQTLDEVVWNYDQGWSSSAVEPSAKSRKIAPLGLSEQDRADLVAFLETLTGAPLPDQVQSPPEIPP